MLTQAQIARMIPHAGRMCLLERVLAWDATTIRCSSGSHRDPANPLRVGKDLPALCAIEYAAQAMAVHGGLCGTTAARPTAGYLASLRDVACLQSVLDSAPGDLVVEAERLMGDEARVIYRFAVWVGQTEIMNGRATVVLDVRTANA
ncbi:MAG TPA: hydroxymyristoyl-ACP dehydratase [Burkholderiales bacterium]|nr:hydroxymyristoyl-ACP dehydratase [Burkholderiales bacterium]